MRDARKSDAIHSHMASENAGNVRGKADVPDGGAAKINVEVRVRPSSACTRATCGAQLVLLARLILEAALNCAIPD
jgi:hypothetical protein